jgi:hypothetical protein
VLKVDHDSKMDARGRGDSQRDAEPARDFAGKARPSKGSVVYATDLETGELIPIGWKSGTEIQLSDRGREFVMKEEE